MNTNLLVLLYFDKKKVFILVKKNKNPNIALSKYKIC